MTIKPRIQEAHILRRYLAALYKKRNLRALESKRVLVMALRMPADLRLTALDSLRRELEGDMQG